MKQVIDFGFYWGSHICYLSVTKMKIISDGYINVVVLSDK
jgi:hypothetical protein